MLYLFDLFRGVWVIFLTSAGLMVITLVYFVTGVLAERAICQPLHHPGDTRIFAMIDQLVHFEERYTQQPGLKSLKVSDIIRLVCDILCDNDECELMKHETKTKLIHLIITSLI